MLWMELELYAQGPGTFSAPTIRYLIILSISMQMRTSTPVSSVSMLPGLEGSREAAKSAERQPTQAYPLRPSVTICYDMVRPWPMFNSKIVTGYTVCPHAPDSDGPLVREDIR